MRFLSLFCSSLIALRSVAAQSTTTDGSNLETFPTILDPSTATVLPSSGSATPSSLSVFNPSSLDTAHGPAVPPTATATSTPLPSSSNATASGPRTTLVSASAAAANRSLSESVVTSTVDGSVTTVTVTNSASGATQTSGAGGSSTLRRREQLGFAVAAGLGAVVLLGTGW
ncbi:hypothetical protein JCM1840_000896 [Sporobolomyces johnsonii]